MCVGRLRLFQWADSCNWQGSNKKDVQLVKLILGIAGNLKVPVVAEGVETEAQLKLLRELGCELVQGYYFSRPLPAAEFEERFMQA